MWPIYGHMTQISFSYIFECFLCKMAKNCKKILRIQKLSPFFAPYGDHYDPPLGGSAGGGDGSHMEWY